MRKKVSFQTFTQSKVCLRCLKLYPSDSFCIHHQRIMNKCLCCVPFDRNRSFYNKWFVPWNRNLLTLLTTLYREAGGDRRRSHGLNLLGLIGYRIRGGRSASACVHAHFVFNWNRRLVEEVLYYSCW